jgi:lipopolysaccharide/colanic/teichoic acid biosynthesis glycosyltransferase
MTPRNLPNTILTSDLVWGVLAMPLAYLMRYGLVWHGPADGSALIFLAPLMASLLIWSVMSSWVPLDGFRSGWKFSSVISQLLLAVLGLMCALFALAYLMREYISRLALGYFGLLLFAGFLAIRVIAKSILVSRRFRRLVRKVVIVGNGPLAREMVTKIEGHPEMLREIVGFLGPGEDGSVGLPGAECRQSIILNSSEIAEELRTRGVDEIILTVATPSHPEIVDLTSKCSARGIAVSMVPQPYELYLTRHELNDLDGVPLLELFPVTESETEPYWKRAFDICITLVLLPLCLLPMLFGAAILKLTKGRAFCRERRCGKQGEHFDIYRLNSPRTATGLPPYESLLQKLSITELPQLFNVLRGDMSLVGPRPEGLDRARRYTDWHRQRLKAKPGITGLAQIHGLRDQHPSEDKTRYDLQYILHQSLFQDISLLLQTAWTLILRLLQGQRHESDEDAKSEKMKEFNSEENLLNAHSSQSSAD